MEAYLDNSATTQPCKEAVDKMNYALKTCWGNPSSLHGSGLRYCRPLPERTPGHEKPDEGSSSHGNFSPERSGQHPGCGMRQRNRGAGRRCGQTQSWFYQRRPSKLSPGR